MTEPSAPWRSSARRRAGAALALALLAGSAGVAMAESIAGQSLEARRARLELLTQQEDQLAGELGASRNALARLLGALELFSRDPPPPLLVSPRDAKDAVRAMILARAIAPALESRARRLEAEAQALDNVRREAAQASGDLFAAESAIADRQGRLSAVARDAALLTPPSARVTAEALPPPPTHLAPPAPGPVAVRFGGRLESGLTAHGLAWRPGAGAVIRSPASAVVAFAGPLAGWGQVVILRTGGGCHMVLSGLGKVSVAPGQSVAAADPVGRMPVNGQSPPELYLEVRMAGAPVDPARFLNGGRG